MDVTSEGVPAAELSEDDLDRELAQLHRPVMTPSSTGLPRR